MRLITSKCYRSICYQRVIFSTKIDNIKWVMHNHDKDIRDPSCPHCHAVGPDWKLNIYTGCYYNYPDKTLQGKLNKKDLLTLWNEKGFLKQVYSEREWYEKEYHSKDPIRYPSLPLPVPDIKSKKYHLVTVNGTCHLRTKTLILEAVSRTKYKSKLCGR